MNPVIALDVAEGKSMAIIMKNETEVFKKQFEFKHELNELNNVYKLIESVEKSTNSKCEVIMEATSIYHEVCESYFTAKSINVLVVNPLLTRLNTSSIRKTKTDKKDCENLAKAYYKKDYIVSGKRTGIYLDMKHLSRQYASLEKNMVRYKNRFKQLLSVIFPGYIELYKNQKIYETQQLLFLKQYPHPYIILNVPINELDETMYKLSGFKRRSCYLSKVTNIRDIAANTYPAYNENSYQVQNLQEQIDLILNLEDRLQAIRKQLIELGRKTPLLKILDSIPGITEITAAFMIAELGDINRFDNRNQLIAYCGLDSSEKQSGKYHIKGGISKRGNKRIRKILYTIMSGMKMNKYLKHGNPIWDFYIKKQQVEGKHKFTSTIAAEVKLLRIAFALCKTNSLFKSI